MENDFSWLSLRSVTDADLDPFDGKGLDIMRNSIFARYGRRFNNQYLQQYFNGQSWYTPKYSPQEFPIKLLSKLEIQNAEFIDKYQDRTGKRFVKK